MCTYVGTFFKASMRYDHTIGTGITERAWHSSKTRGGGLIGYAVYGINRSNSCKVEGVLLSMSTAVMIS